MNFLAAKEREKYVRNLCLARPWCCGVWGALSPKRGDSTPKLPPWPPPEGSPRWVALAGCCGSGEIEEMGSHLPLCCIPAPSLHPAGLLQGPCLWGPSYPWAGYERQEMMEEEEGEEERLSLAALGHPPGCRAVTSRCHKPVSQATVSAPCPGSLPNPEALPEEIAGLGSGTAGVAGMGQRRRHQRALRPSWRPSQPRGWMARGELAIPRSWSWESAKNARSSPIPSLASSAGVFSKGNGMVGDRGEGRLSRGSAPLLLAHRGVGKAAGMGRELPGGSHPREIRVGSGVGARAEPGAAPIPCAASEREAAPKSPLNKGQLCLGALQSDCIPKNPEASSDI